MNLRTKTPCCARVVTLPAAPVATGIHRRTCAACRTLWQIIVRPSRPMPRLAGASFNVLEWIKVTP